MSLFVAPVIIENFGQVSPLAMNMELPVAAYDVGALSEIPGGDETLAFPGYSAKLADIIIDLLDDREKRLRIGKANRRRALELFSVEAMVESYERLYDELIGSGSALLNDR